MHIRFRWLPAMLLSIFLQMLLYLTLINNFQSRMLIACRYIHVPFVCTSFPVGPEESFRSPGTGVADRRLWAPLWVLGIKSESSGRTASAHNHWAMYLQPLPRFLTKCIIIITFVCFCNLDSKDHSSADSPFTLLFCFYFNIFSTHSRVWRQSAC